MDEMLTIRLDTKLAAALREESAQTGLSKGEIARQALENRFGKQRKSSVMQRYFGVIEGPNDLSTNKAYRKSWGKKAK